ncbi:uncharacterized protein LOC129588500 [Paramacrobiotus metropolitanus]|uniref:uncharacterized protein LOC129588500 n=1 Tax=Paramacrobiotus metropolitanus TaxID=2943436 RepID=UPI0024459713|nr:uncharacterized protein LOC129588500 [Paramacrobiotus metropolitanus]
MSLWEKTQRLQGDALEQLRAIYSQCLPIEVRHYCAEWIEAQQWEGIDAYNNLYEKMAMGLLENLLKEVETKAKSLTPNDLVTKMKLEETVTYLRGHYFRTPLHFVQNIRTMLETEKHLVELAENRSSGNSGTDEISSVPENPERSQPDSQLNSDLENVRLSEDLVEKVKVCSEGRDNAGLTSAVEDLLRRRVHLNSNQQSTVAEAFANTVERLRSRWRILSATERFAEEFSTTENVKKIKNFRTFVENELLEILRTVSDITEECEVDLEKPSGYWAVIEALLNSALTEIAATSETATIQLSRRKMSTPDTGADSGLGSSAASSGSKVEPSVAGKDLVDVSAIQLSRRKMSTPDTGADSGLGSSAASSGSKVEPSVAGKDLVDVSEFYALPKLVRDSVVSLDIMAEEIVPSNLPIATRRLRTENV